MTKILVVDDDPQILQINLRARKYDVTAAATGAAALEQPECGDLIWSCWTLDCRTSTGLM